MFDRLAEFSFLRIAFGDLVLRTGSPIAHGICFQQFLEIEAGRFPVLQLVVQVSDSIVLFGNLVETFLQQLVDFRAPLAVRVLFQEELEFPDGFEGLVLREMRRVGLKKRGIGQFVLAFIAIGTLGEITDQPAKHDHGEGIFLELDMHFALVVQGVVHDAAAGITEGDCPESVQCVQPVFLLHFLQPEVIQFFRFPVRVEVRRIARRKDEQGEEKPH